MQSCQRSIDMHDTRVCRRMSIKDVEAKRAYGLENIARDLVVVRICEQGYSKRRHAEQSVTIPVLRVWSAVASFAC